MTTPQAPLREPVEDDIRMARLHLRLGQLTLALAELEDLLGRDALGPRGLGYLAEARWRMGDAQGAATAAEAHLHGGGTDPVALCIAAEAAAADGRSGDARVLMDRLPIADSAALDALFAGMPRRALWPAGPVDRSEIDEIRLDAAARGSGSGATGVRGGAPVRDRADAGAPGSTDVRGVPSRAVPGPREVLEASGAWADIAAQMAADEAARSGRSTHERRLKAQLDPRAELEKAREELGSKPERAFLRMALALRADPTIAPGVLDAIHLRREPEAAILRGDAQRMLGRHLEAEAAFDAAAESLES
ncbi:MAG TPA: hypothetical protein VHR16_02590 [Candidatus Limnocylindrales bacterium]|jgi:hypothetical protein|nr:hypothetical protein [Candidatus Limnocylindrales bacterium]